jgi:hypothetical protein
LEIAGEPLSRREEPIGFSLNASKVLRAIAGRRTAKNFVHFGQRQDYCLVRVHLLFTLRPEYIRYLGATFLRQDQPRGADIKDRIQDPRLRRFFSYWSERRKGQSLPARRDIDPLDFAYLIGHIVLLDVLREPLRFRFRVHGTQLATQFGYDMTGKMAEDVPRPADRAVLIERCTRIAEAGEPLLVARRHPLGKRQVDYEALWLPLADDGRLVTMLLGAAVCHAPGGASPPLAA